MAKWYNIASIIVGPLMMMHYYEYRLDEWVWWGICNAIIINPSLVKVPLDFPPELVSDDYPGEMEGAILNEKTKWMPTIHFIFQEYFDWLCGGLGFYFSFYSHFDSFVDHDDNDVDFQSELTKHAHF